jgi:hypothetical protein
VRFPLHGPPRHPIRKTTNTRHIKVEFALMNFSVTGLTEGEKILKGVLASMFSENEMMSI